MDKRDHLQRAKAFLESDEPASARYAALELRFCLEVMTYEKLRTYSKYLPKSFLDRTWQPPALVRTMVQIDPAADQSTKLYVGSEAIEGVPPRDDEFQLVGEHRAFSARWLSKTYNKLGSMLHAPLRPSNTDREKIRADLVAICAEISAAQEGRMLALMMEDYSTFECQRCKATVMASKEWVRTQARVVCLNPQCEAEYSASIEADGRTKFQLRAIDFPCTQCADTVNIEIRLLEHGLKVQCPACEREHIFQWAYSSVADPAGVDSPAPADN